MFGEPSAAGTLADLSKITMIPFNIPTLTGNEQQYVSAVLQAGERVDAGDYLEKCHAWFEQHLQTRSMLTSSCTHALEMAALLLNIQPGDEVIMPSFTFVSTANAFVLRGARPVFIDISPATLNMNVDLIEAAITPRTRAIVPVHYAGVACEMEQILDIAQRYELYVIEDAAQGMMATYKQKPLGTFGHLGAYSFHSTKNYTSGGEGGLLIINDERLVEKAEIIREKGTNRTQFTRGEISRYTWQHLGSSYLLSELQAAFLWGQLEQAEEIDARRQQQWEYYYQALAELAAEGYFTLPQVPEYCRHNAHIFYLRLSENVDRTDFICHMKQSGVSTPFHYIPLHSSPAGEQFGFFHEQDQYTTRESEKLVRLPLFHDLSIDLQQQVIKAVKAFFYRKSPL